MIAISWVEANLSGLRGCEAGHEADRKEQVASILAAAVAAAGDEVNGLADKAQMGAVARLDSSLVSWRRSIRRHLRQGAGISCMLCRTIISLSFDWTNGGHPGCPYAMRLRPGGIGARKFVLVGPHCGTRGTVRGQDSGGQGGRTQNGQDPGGQGCRDQVGRARSTDSVHLRPRAVQNLTPQMLKIQAKMPDLNSEILVRRVCEFA